eukprot:Ihof_evm1s608 gene=Ihof_evmTU1s608
MVLSDSTIFRDLARAELMALLAGIPGKKDVVVDPSLSVALEFTTPQDFILGTVEGIFPLVDECTTADSATQIYIIAPLPKMTGKVANRVRRDPKRKHTIVFVPRRSMACEKILEQEGVYEYVDIRDLNFSLLPVDVDLLSLETPRFFKTYYLNGVMSPLYQVAQTIVALNGLYGIIPKVYGKGKTARSVFDMSCRMIKDSREDFQKLGNAEGHIKSLIILDRFQDLLTPCMQPTKYSALLDEFYHITLGQATLDFLTDDGTKRTITLDSSDKIYSAIRDTTLSEAAQILHDEVGAVMDEPTSSKHIFPALKQMAARLDPIKYRNLRDHLVLVDKLWYDTNRIGYKEIIDFQNEQISVPQLVTSQLTTATKVMRVGSRSLKEISEEKSLEKLENFMCRRIPVMQMLRLLCLFSLCHGGCTINKWNDIRAMFIKTYGPEHLHTLHGLETLGMIFPESAGISTKKYYGAPILSLYLNHILTYESWDPVKNNKEYDDSFLNTEGETIEVYPNPINFDENNTERPVTTPSGSFVDMASEKGPDEGSVVVLVIGGITHEEISAMRRVAKEK